MTLQEFVAQKTGQFVDWDGAHGYQCVDLFRFYMRDVLGLAQHQQPAGLGNGGAVKFWHNYDTDANLRNNFEKVQNTPRYGDVIIWSTVAEGAGHVAIFLSGTMQSFVSLDQNWPKGSPVTEVNHGATNVIGILRPRNQAPIGQP